MIRESFLGPQFPRNRTWNIARPVLEKKGRNTHDKKKIPYEFWLIASDAQRGTRDSSDAHSNTIRLA